MAYALCLMASFLMFVIMMQVKGDVFILLRERKTLALDQKQLHEDLRVLEAEYAHLANFDRMITLAEQRGFKEASMKQLLREDL